MRDSTEAAAVGILSRLDEGVWDSIAVKAITRMAPIKMKDESVHIFNDFTRLNAVMKTKSGTTIKQEHDQAKNIVQNYLVGTTKMIEKTERALSEKVSDKSSKHLFFELTKTKGHRRSKTEVHDNEKKQKGGKKVNNFFRLTHESVKNEEEQKLEDGFRNTKYTDEKYVKGMQEAKKELEEKRMYRTVIEKKRFKEMKVFTYDFEGRLMSMGQKAAQESHRVVNMRPQFSDGFKSSSFERSRRTSASRVNQVFQKKVISYQRPTFAEMTKQKKQQQLQQERTQRRASFLKNVSTNKFANMFNKDTRMQVGVSITDMGNRERVAGEERDRSEKKNLKLSEFKEKVKMESKFPNHRNLNLKLRMKTASAYRTEGDESLVRQKGRTKTQGDISSKMSSVYPRFGTSRGRIHIEDNKLYSENFIPSSN